MSQTTLEIDLNISDISGSVKRLGTERVDKHAFARGTCLMGIIRIQLKISFLQCVIQPLDLQGQIIKINSILNVWVNTE